MQLHLILHVAIELIAAEDALNPSRPDGLPWHAESGFDDELGAAVREIAASANLLLIERLEALLEIAPPSVRVVSSESTL